MCTRNACVSALAALAFACPFATPAVLRVRADAPGPDHDGLNWETAFVTIQSAVTAAQTGDEAWVAAGIYRENVVIPASSSVSLYGGFTGVEEVRSQRQLGTDATVISGISGSVLCIRAANVTVDGFTITGGRMRCCVIYSLEVMQEGQGTGVFCVGDDVIVTNNVIRSNTCDGDRDHMVPHAGSGAGVFCAGANAYIGHNTISENKALGIQYWDPFNCYSGHEAAGAGVFVSGPGATIEANTMSGNSILFDSGPGGQGCQVRNTADGAGIAAAVSGTVMRRNVISGNSLKAISTSMPGDHESYPSGVARGAGIYATGARVEDNLIVGNTTIGNATSSGAGIYLRGASTIRNNTISGNSAFWATGEPATAAGISATSECLVVNNVLAGNNAASALPGAPRLRNDIFEDATVPAGTDISADPMFVDRAGGNFRLRPGSPCIDTGDASGATAGASDLDGRPRLIGAQVDIGTYEAPDLAKASDAARALAIAAGIAGAGQGDLTRLDVALGDSAGRVDVSDAVLLLRRANGVDG